MNNELKTVTAGAIANLHYKTVCSITPILNNVLLLECQEKELNKLINSFRDKLRKKVKIKDLFIYYIFTGKEYYLVCEFDTPSKLTNEKLGNLLNYLDLYEYQKIESDKEVFLLFDLLDYVKSEKVVAYD